jgi:branched-chain amino acid transport system substrate-binding protein
MYRTSRRRRRAAAAGLVCILITSGCGSLLAEEELREAAGIVTQPVPSDPVAAGTGGAALSGPTGPEQVADPGSAGPGDVRADGKPAGASLDGPAIPSDQRNGPAGNVSRPAAPTSASTPPSNPVAPGPPGTGTGTGGTEDRAPRPEIRLGSFGHQSGPLGAIFLPMGQAARAWVADVNARGGLAGHPVKITLIDDGADPARALAAARRLIEEEKVVAFLGTHAAVTLQATIRYIEEQGVPVLGSCGCNQVSDTSPMIFEAGVTAPTGNAWMHMLPLLQLSQRRSVALLYCREAQLCPIIADTIKKLAPQAGIDIRYEAGISLAQPDYTAEVIAARSAGADAAILVADNPTTMRVMSSARRQNYDLVVSVNHSAHDTRFLAFGPPVEGVLTGSIVAPWDASPKMADYRAAMDRWLPGSVKASLGAQTWVLGKLLEHLAPQLPAGELSSADILKALHSLDRETLGGIMPPTTYRPGVGHADTNQCTIPLTVSGGRFVPPKGETFACAPGWKPLVRDG